MNRTPLGHVGTGPVLLSIAGLLSIAVLCPGQQQALPPRAATPLSQASATKSPATFRVMTYNIHHGEGTDGRIDLQRIADLVLAEKADLVALEEVDKGVERTARRDLPAELASLTGMTCLFRSNFPFQGGEYGNAILTRFPVRKWTNTLLRMLRTGEQRGILQAVVEAGGRDLLFLATHIDYRQDDAERRQNVSQLREVLAEYGAMPAVVGGDFNDVPSSRTHEAMAAMFDDGWTKAGDGDGFTYPSGAPAKRIDYLWIRQAAPLRVVRAWVPRSAASDHLPLVAELEWTR